MQLDVLLSLLLHDIRAHATDASSYPGVATSKRDWPHWEQRQAAFSTLRDYLDVMVTCFSWSAAIQS